MDPRDFYDGLADQYHLIYADWWASLRRQAAVLDGLIVRELGDGPKRLLDCTCGIGTQALGLAELGHRVTGTDLSPGAIDRARREAAHLGLEIRLEVADLRSLGEQVPSGFDVVLSCDNSLPHLPSEGELRKGVRGMASVLRKDGLLMVSLRDYDALVKDRPRATPVRVAGREGKRRVVFQLWTWNDGEPSYELELILLEEGPGGWAVRSHRAEYRAILRDELSAVVRAETGGDPRWLMPEESGFFQPLLVAPLRDRSHRPEELA